MISKGIPFLSLHPAILHELASETRAGSAVSVDPIEVILGIPTK